MKITGQIIEHGTELTIKTKMGNFFLDRSSSFTCIPTQNILKAANFPKDKNFEIELIENTFGLLVFIHPEMMSAGYYFNDSYVSAFTYSDDDMERVKLLTLIFPKSWEKQSVAFDLFINEILITGEK